MKNTKRREKHISHILFSTLFFIAVFFVCFFFPNDVFGAQKGYVNASDLNVRTKPNTDSQVVGSISYEEVSILGTASDGAGNLWHKISYAGGEYYVFGAYVSLIDDSQVQPPSEEYGSFEEQLSRFPVSYRSKLEKIHQVYPNYIFQADYINMHFDDAVYQETLNHRKLVDMDCDGVSWRSRSASCYNWSTGKWSTYSGNWTDAGIDVLEFYMDPRNFLNTNNMYIFAQQTYTGAETRRGVETIAGSSFLSGTYTDSTGTHAYIDTIMKVAADSKVSPYVIAATIRQEQPYSGNSALIDGSRGYYNFFNFGASGSDVVGNGISYAKQQGWDTVYKSMLGGAKGYYNGYLRDGQDTYFYKDYNVINGDFDHQYAQSAYDQIGNGMFLRDAIGGDTNATVVLRIPIYKTMPDVPQGYPEETSKFNARYEKGGKVIPRKTPTITTAVDIANANTPEEPPTDPPEEEPDEGEDGSNLPTEPGSSGGTDGDEGSGGSGSTDGADEGQTPQPEKPPENPQPKYQAGDANGDGKVSALDYVAIKNHILGTTLIKDADKKIAADANGDGKISALDYVIIKNTILGR